MIGKLTFVYGGKTYSDVPLDMEVSEHCTFSTSVMVAKVKPNQAIVFNDRANKGFALLAKEHPEYKLIVTDAPHLLRLGFKKISDHGIPCVVSCIADTGAEIANEQECIVESSVRGCTHVRLRYVVCQPDILPPKSSPTSPTTEMPK